MGFGELRCIHLGVKCEDRRNILGPDWGQVWPAWAPLRYVETTALLLAAKLGLLRANLAIGYREVMLFWPCCLLFVLHPEMLSPQQDQDFKWVSASYVGSIGGSSTAILRLCWHCWHHLGINFGHLGAHDDSSGDTSPASPKTTPNYTSKTLSPMALKALRRNRRSSKNHSKNKISSNKNQPKIRLQKAAGAAKSSRDRLRRKAPPSRAIGVRCFCGNADWRQEPQ